MDITVRAVLFDMDGTLVDSTAVVVGAWSRWGNKYGIDAEVILRYSHGRQTLDTVRHFLPERSEEECERIAAETLLDEEFRTDGIVEVPGAAAVVRSLQAAGVPVVLVTSAPRTIAMTRMRAADVPIPEMIVTSEDVAVGKPDPSCFRQGAALLGVDATDCVAFEDAEAGIAAAVASGAHTVVVGAHASLLTAGLDRVVDHRATSVEPVGDGWFRIRS